MAMSYDSALITGSQVVNYTGIQDLSNLATDGELTLDTFVLEGHREVYRRLEQAGVDPTNLTNQGRLSSAVAYAACKRLAMGGYLDPLSDRERSVQMFREHLDYELSIFVPESSDDDLPSYGDGAIPQVGNFEDGWSFSEKSEFYYDDLPEAL